MAFGAEIGAESQKVCIVLDSARSGGRRLLARQCGRHGMYQSVSYPCQHRISWILHDFGISANSGHSCLYTEHFSGVKVIIGVTLRARTCN